MGDSNGDGPGSYDPETQTYRLVHDWEDDIPVSTRIIEAVAVVTDTPATDIGPFFEVMDPSALDNLFLPTTNGIRRQADSRVAFTLNDCEVTVYGNGLIEIQLPTKG